MHARIKLACVVLAWTILPVGLASAGPGRSAPPVQVSARTTPLNLTSARAATAPAPRAPVTARSYVVQRGDTLSAIATRFTVPGGWPTLYAANRSRIGANPNLLEAGQVLDLPGAAAPVRYTVTDGQTLSGIAGQFAVRGGWPALYAANRAQIGPDPGRIQAGLRLTIPVPAASPASSGATSTAPAPASPVPSRPQAGPQPASPAPSSPAPVPSARAAPHQAQSQPATRISVWAWLGISFLAAGLICLLVLVVKSFLGSRRQRRLAVSAAGPAQVHESGPAHPANSAPEAFVMPAPADPGHINPTHILIADHDRVIVTRDQGDDTICVLRPPGADPMDILRVARLVLPEGPYGTLAERLGVSASWPIDQ